MDQEGPSREGALATLAAFALADGGALAGALAREGAFDCALAALAASCSPGPHHSSAVALHALCLCAELAAACAQMQSQQSPSAAGSGSWRLAGLAGCVQALEQHANAPRAQQEACRAALRLLCCSTGDAALDGPALAELERELSVWAVRAVNAHPAHMGLQSWGRRLLTQLDAQQHGRAPLPMAFVDPHQASPANSGASPAQPGSARAGGGGGGTSDGVETVLKALRTHAQDGEVCDKGLAVLLSKLSGAGWRIQDSPACAQAAVACLRQHPQHPGVARRAAAFLQLLSKGGWAGGDRRSVLACVAACEEAQPCAALLLCLRSIAPPEPKPGKPQAPHPDPSLAQPLLVALANMAQLSPDSALRCCEQAPDAFRILLIHLAASSLPGGTPAAALAAEACLDAIAALSEPRTEQLALTAGSVPRCMSALRTHGASARIAGAAASALGALSSAPAGCAALAEAGGLEELLRCGKTHMLDPGVCTRIAGALWNATVSSDNQAALASAGGVSWLVATLRRHGCEEEGRGCAEACCGSLRNIACESDFAERCAAEGTLGAVLVAMRFHSSAEEVQEVGASCVGNLVASPAGCVAAMFAEPESFEVAELALRALAASAAMGGPLRRAALDAGAEAAVAGALERHGQHSMEVRVWAERVEAALAGRPAAQTVVLATRG